MTAIDRVHAEAAVKATLRVICSKADSAGSGFLHTSGRVITAAHVVHGCAAADVVLLRATGQQVQVTDVVADDKLDIAVLTPAAKLEGGLKLRPATGDVSIGVPVAAWGYPIGYPGLRPLLTMGYIGGASPTEQNGPPKLWINGAFNSGNSGGPLVLAETGEVIGIVSSKLAPIPSTIEQALDVMSKQQFGMMYPAKNPDGTTVNVSEAQVITTVLQYLRSQTQLVIGMAVPWGDVAAFMNSKNITP